MHTCSYCGRTICSALFTLLSASPKSPWPIFAAAIPAPTDSAGAAAAEPPGGHREGTVKDERGSAKLVSEISVGEQRLLDIAPTLQFELSQQKAWRGECRIPWKG